MDLPMNKNEFRALQIGDKVKRIDDSRRNGIRNNVNYDIVSVDPYVFNVLSDDKVQFTVSREKCHLWSFVEKNQPTTTATNEVSNLSLFPYQVIVTNTKNGKIILHTTVTKKVTLDRESVLVDLAVKGKIKSVKNLQVSITSL